MSLRKRVEKLEQGTGQGQERSMAVCNDRHLAEALALVDAGYSLYAVVDDADFARRLSEAGATVVRFLGNVKLSML